jgi:endonuclease YncB( thermonuclease family)
MTAPSKKSLAVIFTAAAGITAGGVIGIGALMQQKNARDDFSAAAQTPPPRSAQKSGLPGIPAEIIAIDGDVVTVRAHTWVGQFVEARVTIDDRDPNTIPPTALVADIAGGQMAVGENIILANFQDGGVPDDGVSLHIAPPVRPRQDIVAGPIPAHVVKLVDGDTVQVVAEVWPGQVVLTDVRIRDIDTPEKKGRAKCPEEAALAEKASAATQSLIGGKNVLLYNVQFEKYGGRVLGDIRTLDGVSAAQHLIDNGLARPYDGKTKSSWCAPVPPKKPAGP